MIWWQRLIKIAGRTDLIGLKRSASSGQEILIRVSVMRKNSMDMGQVLAAEAPDPEMKRAEMQMEKVQGEEMQVQAAETGKKPRQQNEHSRICRKEKRHPERS